MPPCMTDPSPAWLREKPRHTAGSLPYALTSLRRFQQTIFIPAPANGTSVLIFSGMIFTRSKVTADNPIQKKNNGPRIVKILSLTFSIDRRCTKILRFRNDAYSFRDECRCKTNCLESIKICVDKHIPGRKNFFQNFYICKCTFKRETNVNITSVFKL